MGNVARFAALSTKLDAISGRFLQEEDYEALLHKEKVTEVARYLKENTHYANLLADVDPDDVHRGDLNLLLSRKVIEITEKLAHFTSHNYKELMKALLIRYEVEDLKLILRAISRNEDVRSLDALFIHSKKFSHLDYEQLLSISSIEDMVALLRGTIYEEAFRSITQEDLELREFHAEMNLDFVYFKNLLKKSKNLSNEDRKILEELIGINIDLINIQWLYRARKYYGLSPEEILNYTLPGGIRYKFSQLKDLVYQDDPIEAVISSVKYTYPKIVAMKDIYIERKIYQYLYDMFKKSNRENRMNIAKLTSVLHFLEYEIRDIITIIEGIRYDVPVEAMKDFLIRNFD